MAIGRLTSETSRQTRAEKKTAKHDSFAIIA